MTTTRGLRRPDTTPGVAVDAIGDDDESEEDDDDEEE
jgi:hypothetical protein